jgi:hypothetical protein
MADFTVTSTVKVSDRLLTTPFTTHEAVLAIAEALVSDNPFEAAEIAISRKRFSGTYAMHDTSVENCPVSVISITDYEKKTDDAWLYVKLDTGFRDSVGFDELTDAEAGYPNASSASVTVRVKNESETFYVAFTNERVRVYSYEDDAVVTALETWADGKPALG